MNRKMKISDNSGPDGLIGSREKLLSKFAVLKDRGFLDFSLNQERITPLEDSSDYGDDLTDGQRFDFIWEEEPDPDDEILGI